MYIELIQNLSLLVAISVISGFIAQRWTRNSRTGAIIQGALFGGAAVIGMLGPLVLSPGLIFDGRSVMLSLCALFFGPWAAIISVLMAIPCRIWLGGGGALMGVLVILSSAGIGILAHYRWKPQDNPPSTLMLYLFGITVHLVMLGLVFTLPDNTGLSALKKIGLPVILLFPLATILAGEILSEQMDTFNFMKKLQGSEKKYKDLVENANSSILRMDRIGTITFINEYALHFFGYSREEVIGRNLVGTITPPFDSTGKDQSQIVFNIVADPERYKNNENENIHKDGTRFWMAWTNKLIMDNEGHCVEVLCIGNDITERKKAESRRNQQLHFAEALNKIAEIIISKDNANDILEGTNRIIGETLQVDRTLIYDVSFEKYRITGLCEWLRLDHPDIAPTKDEYDLNLFLNPFSEIRRTQKYLESYSNAVDEHFIGDGSGKILHEQLKIKSLIWYPFAFDAHGYYAFTVNQIIEQRQWTKEEIAFLESVAKQTSLALIKIRLLEEQEKLEAQLRQSQKMDAIGQLAGGIAHDFNNMLAVINGHSQMALKTLEPSDPIYRSIQEINKAGQRSAELTRQLLAFARKQVATPNVLDINDNIKNMLDILRRILGENIKIDWKPMANLWQVKINTSQLDQILMNLLVNSRDAISGTGKVTIETGNTELDGASCKTKADLIPGKYVVLSVSDNGCGMDKKTADHAFEPFFTTKELGKGTGLGLATVFAIVRQNNGFIDAHSEPGKGTTFKIYLPRYESANEKTHPTEEKQQIPTGTETILLVEDEESILQIAIIQIEDLGYTVLSAGNPIHAIKLAEEYKGDIHLLMTDVIMPEMSGRELRNIITSARPGIKSLFMSGYSADIIANKGILYSVSFMQAVRL